MLGPRMGNECGVCVMWVAVLAKAKPIVFAIVACSSIVTVAGCASQSPGQEPARAGLATTPGTVPAVQSPNYERPQPWPNAARPAPQPTYQPASGPEQQSLQPLQIASMRPLEPVSAPVIERPAQPVSAHQVPPARLNRENVAAEATPRIVEVQQGDTLYGIARRNKIKVEQLMEANSLSSFNIQVGQKLTLP